MRLSAAFLGNNGWPIHDCQFHSSDKPICDHQKHVLAAIMGSSKRVGSIGQKSGPI